MTKQNNGGFTLIELVIAIAIGTIITGAVLSILLFGMRINGKTADSTKQLQATNMLAEILQTVAEQPNISVQENKIVQMNIGADGTATVGQVYVKHEGSTIYLNNAAFMEDVDFFTAVMSPDNQLLTITLKVDSKKYESTSYCRLNPIVPPSEEAAE